MISSQIYVEWNKEYYLFLNTKPERMSYRLSFLIQWMRCKRKRYVFNEKPILIINSLGTALKLCQCVLSYIYNLIVHPSNVFFFKCPQCNGKHKFTRSRYNLFIRIVKYGLVSFTLLFIQSIGNPFKILSRCHPWMVNIRYCIEIYINNKAKIKT